jgi:hypothetical protein
VIVAVAVTVAAPVIVAALVNWNDIVKVIDAARLSRIEKLCEHGHDELHASDIGRHSRRLRARLRALTTPTASFPLTSAATTTQWPRRLTPPVLIARSKSY